MVLNEWYTVNKEDRSYMYAAFDGVPYEISLFSW